jgi:hypothetical protein
MLCALPGRCLLLLFPEEKRQSTSQVPRRRRGFSPQPSRNPGRCTILMSYEPLGPISTSTLVASLLIFVRVGGGVQVARRRRPMGTTAWGRAGQRCPEGRCWWGMNSTQSLEVVRRRRIWGAGRRLKGMRWLRDLDVWMGMEDLVLVLLTMVCCLDETMCLFSQYFILHNLYPRCNALYSGRCNAQYSGN